MKKRYSIFIASLFLLASLNHTIYAQSETDTQTQLDRPRIGLVLGGGGARGAAHIGVLKALEAEQVPIDLIIGTSMGAIIGGLYASGYSPEDLENLIESIDWRTLLRDAPDRKYSSFRRKQDDFGFLVKFELGFKWPKFLLPRGFIQGQRLGLLLQQLTLPVASINDFDDLPIPFRAIATDIETDEQVILGCGNLAQAIRASMSVPGVFAPVEINHRLLVDGGIVNNLPIDVAHQLGADIVIAVDVTSPLVSQEKLTSAFAILGQMLNTLVLNNTQQQRTLLTLDDILITPDLGEMLAANFTESPSAIHAGEIAAQAQVDALQRLSVSSTAYDAFLAKQRQPAMPPPIVDFVRVQDDSNLSPKVAEGLLHIPLQQPLDVKQLDKDIAKIYGQGYYEQVSYRLVEEAEETGVVVNARKKSWGPNYFRFGLSLEDDFTGNSNYNVATRFTMTTLNKLGAEWRTDGQLGERPGFFTEFYQPLTYESRFFVAPQLDYNKRNVGVFEDGNQTADYRVTTTLIGADVGKELGTWGEFRTGLRHGWGDVDLRVGEPQDESYHFNSGFLLAKLTYDQLDQVSFPHHGSYNAVTWTGSRGWLGADHDFDQLFVRSIIARTWWRTTLRVDSKLGATFAGDPAVENNFPLGGFLNLSGFSLDEFSGQHLGFTSLIGYYQLTGTNSSSIKIPIYLGGSIETGNAWQDTDDISVDSLRWAGSAFIGIDTLLGPFYLAYGHAEGGRDLFYLFLGRTF